MNFIFDFQGVDEKSLCGGRIIVIRLIM